MLHEDRPAAHDRHAPACRSPRPRCDMSPPVGQAQPRGPAAHLPVDAPVAVHAVAGERGRRPAAWRAPPQAHARLARLAARTAFAILAGAIPGAPSGCRMPTQFAITPERAHHPHRERVQAPGLDAHRHRAPLGLADHDAVAEDPVRGAAAPSPARTAGRTAGRACARTSSRPASTARTPRWRSAAGCGTQRASIAAPSRARPARCAKAARITASWPRGPRPGRSSSVAPAQPATSAPGPAPPPALRPGAGG